jgi:hypothetical protein
MKQIIVILIITFASCQKWNAILIPWLVEEGYDNYPTGHSFFCDHPDSFWKRDTMWFAYNNPPLNDSLPPGISHLIPETKNPEGITGFKRYYGWAEHMIK